MPNHKIKIATVAAALGAAAVAVLCLVYSFVASIQAVAVLPGYDSVTGEFVGTSRTVYHYSVCSLMRDGGLYGLFVFSVAVYALTACAAVVLPAVTLWGKLAAKWQKVLRWALFLLVIFSAIMYFICYVFAVANTPNF